jgi:hypothetical protein
VKTRVLEQGIGGFDDVLTLVEDGGGMRHNGLLCDETGLSMSTGLCVTWSSPLVRGLRLTS